PHRAEGHARLRPYPLRGRRSFRAGLRPRRADHAKLGGAYADDRSASIAEKSAAIRVDVGGHVTLAHGCTSVDGQSRPTWHRSCERTVFMCPGFACARPGTTRPRHPSRLPDLVAQVDGAFALDGLDPPQLYGCAAEQPCTPADQPW